jgi:hypothetical protein
MIASSRGRDRKAAILDDLARDAIVRARRTGQPITVITLEEIANQWYHDYQPGSERREASSILGLADYRAAYRLVVDRLRRTNDSNLIGQGLGGNWPRVTVQQFAAQLTCEGARVVWLDTITFEADNQRRMGSRRSVRVYGFRDTHGFSFAEGGGGQRLRSMAAVRRHLRLGAAG